MPYESEGNIRLNPISIEETETVNTQTEWEDTQEENNVVIENGVVSLAEEPANQPDSVITISYGGDLLSTTDSVGVQFESTIDWPSFGVELSSLNGNNVAEVGIYRTSDGIEMGSVSVPTDSSGHTVTFDNINLSANTTYNLIAIPASGGFDVASLYGPTITPISSDDGNLTVTGAAYGEQDTASDNLFAFSAIGYVGFGSVSSLGQQIPSAIKLDATDSGNPELEVNGIQRDGTDITFEVTNLETGNFESRGTTNFDGSHTFELALVGGIDTEIVDYEFNIEFSSFDGVNTPEVNSITLTLPSGDGNGETQQYESQGNVRLNPISIEETETVDTQTEWEDNQEENNVVIENGIVTLAPLDFEIPVPDSGISRWTFNDVDTNNSTNTANDVWGGNNGTINGAQTSIVGANQTYPTNEAYSFGGGSDVSIPVNIITDRDLWSIACWFNVDAFGSEMRFISFREDLNLFLNIGRVQDNTLGVWTFGTDHAILSITTNQWYHSVITYNGTDLIGYVDGQEELSVTQSSEGGTGDVSAIGSDGGNSFEGDIDDPRVYDKELSSTEVLNLYETGSING